MEEDEESPSQIYIVADVVEEILLRLPLKSILRFKTVSREWRSTLESRRFADRRMLVQKKQKILAVGGNQIQSRFQGDAEIEAVYLECDEATRPSLTCKGVVCIPEPNWVSVLNPSTGEFFRFCSGPFHYENATCLLVNYSITLAHIVVPMHGGVTEERSTMFTPLAVSKEGCLFFCDTKKRLFKYDPETDFLCGLSSDICVISPFV